MWNLSLLQSLGPEAASLPALHRAFFSPATPLAAISALLPRLQRESQRASLEMMAPTLPRPVRGRVPMLVVGGDGDVLIPTISLSEAALYHGADLDVLKGAPHGLMLDLAWWQPSADSVLAWLDQKKL
jgi:pimeloyl-ACP methyl ester carboxylesterase